MKNVLFVDCCIRREASNTKKLAEAFLAALPSDCAVTRLDLMAEDISYFKDSYFDQREALLAENRRKFALIHFAGSSECKVDVFLPGQYSMQDKLNAAETFLGGGTNFKRPLDEAIQLMNAGFENADIVFLTDGLCELPEDYLAKLYKEQAARKFTVTGILLDAGNPGMDFSLTPFCQKIYRTSELAGDEIVRGLVTQRM